jgi:hypothetical protein
LEWFLSFILIVSFASCSKKLLEEDVKPKDAPLSHQRMVKSANFGLPYKVNPLSLSNVLLAKQELDTANTNTMLYPENHYIYFKFNPEQLPAQLFKAMEADTSLRLMTFPFADGSIYGDEVGFNETIAERLADGSIWGVTKLNNPIINNILNESAIRAVSLDTLYAPTEDQEYLYAHAVARTEANTPLEIAKRRIRIRICVRRPQGRVRYRDSSLGNQMLPVIHTQVWAIKYGVPLTTFTDTNGNFGIWSPYIVGTIVGTKAENPRVNVKPLNTSGTIAGNILSIIANFVAGSVHVHGWVGACDLNNITIDYNDHRQNRYWAQILNAVYFHDQFCSQDQIASTPFA